MKRSSISLAVLLALCAVIARPAMSAPSTGKLTEFSRDYGRQTAKHAETFSCMADTQQATKQGGAFIDGMFLNGVFEFALSKDNTNAVPT